MDAASLLSFVVLAVERGCIEDTSDHEHEADTEDEQDDVGEDDLAPWDSNV